MDIDTTSSTNRAIMCTNIISCCCIVKKKIKVLFFFSVRLPILGDKSGAMEAERLERVMRQTI